MMPDTPLQSRKANTDFDAGWARLTLMIRDPGHFSTLFLFNGNDVRKQALLERLKQTLNVQNRSLLWLIAPSHLHAALTQVEQRSSSALPNTAQTRVEAITKQVLQQIFAVPENKSPDAVLAGQLSLIVLELDGMLQQRLREIGLTHDESSDEAETLRASLLSRLNERRELLARRAPMLIILPNNWTKRAALYAPDLWAVRLTSHYLHPHKGAAVELTGDERKLFSPVDPRHDDSPELPDEMAHVHELILERWLNAIQKDSIDSMAISDGWIAIETSQRKGNSQQTHRLATQVLALAYQRGNAREQLISQNYLGDTFLAFGSLEDALQAYAVALQLAEAQCQSDPSNSDWQRDLSVSFDKVAGIYEAQGDRVRALERYESSLAIREKLVKSDPSNSDWQRDLSVSFDKVAGIYEAQGDRVRALERYESSLAIREKLVKSDPSNSDWQRDLWVSHNKVAGIYEAQGDRVRALERYESSLAISEKLVKSDPSNSDWQRDLSVSHNKVAGIYEAQGDRVRALERYESSLAIREKLVKSDPSNAQWQMDLVVSYFKLSGLHPWAVNTAQARVWLNRALEILLKLQRAGALTQQQLAWPGAIQSRLATLGDQP